MKDGLKQAPTSKVPERAKQGGEPRDRDWSWVEATVWTERMLSALGNGIKGNKWFSLVDKVERLPDPVSEGVTISTDGRGRALGNIFGERLWRNVKYEDVYLNGYPPDAESVFAAAEDYGHETVRISVCRAYHVSN